MNDSAERPEAVDLETVQAELAPILSTMSWTRTDLEQVKQVLTRWTRDLGDGQRHFSDTTSQHGGQDDALDEAIDAEHERVEDARSALESEDGEPA
jgi:hypothetical protein